MESASSSEGHCEGGGGGVYASKSKKGLEQKVMNNKYEAGVIKGWWFGVVDSPNERFWQESFEVF